MELELRHVSKQYGKKTVVDDVSAVLTPGVYGLLGANGAGKTTLMRMLCGVLQPACGGIYLNGEEKESLGEQYYTHLGYMPQDFGFYPDFTAREFLLYMAAVKGLDTDQAVNRMEMLFDLVNLRRAADKKIKTYSGGMRQRLGIALAELGNPDILILDEPTAGLDPKERIRFRHMISDFSREKIVILSTHIVSDVSSVADTILLMKQGKLLLQKPLASVTDVLEGQVWELSVPEEEAAGWESRCLVVNLRHEGGLMRLRIIKKTPPAANARAVRPNLEDLFLYYFGEEAKEEGGNGHENAGKI